MSTNQILASISMSLLGLCILMAVLVFLLKPTPKVLKMMAGTALVSILAVTVISVILVL
ncbi:MAG: hypothetical protein KDD46_01080 [Bdellovibrionales bacterium]|nr:hypothetical protein [Bdellovibrionales bacterium]